MKHIILFLLANIINANSNHIKPITHHNWESYFSNIIGDDDTTTNDEGGLDHELIEL
jgi:hypothetical protein